MVTEDSGDRSRIGPRDLDLPIQATSPFYCRIDLLRVVRRRDDDDARPLVHASQQLKEQIHDLRPVLDVFASDSGTIGDAVEFVYEQDAGCLRSGPGEDRADRLQRPG